MNIIDPEVALARYRRRGHGLGLVATMAAIATFAFVFYLPQSARRSALLPRQADLEARLRSETATREANAVARRRLADAEGRLQQFQQRLPRDPDEADFLAQLARAASDVDLHVLNYQPGNLTQRETHSELEIDLSGEATYASLVRFLDRLATLRRLTTVVRLEVNAQPLQNLYPINITLLIYFNPLEPTGGAATDGSTAGRGPTTTISGSAAGGPPRG